MWRADKPVADGYNTENGWGGYDVDDVIAWPEFEKAKEETVQPRRIKYGNHEFIRQEDVDEGLALAMNYELHNPWHNKVVVNVK